MGRPRQYPDDAARKRAQRERDSGITPSDPAPPAAPLPEPQGASGVEAYVAEQLAQTKAYAETFTAPEKVHDLPERLIRAEAYARWRWAAYHRGEVFSL